MLFYTYNEWLRMAEAEDIYVNLKTMHTMLYSNQILYQYNSFHALKYKSYWPTLGGQ